MFPYTRCHFGCSIFHAPQPSVCSKPIASATLVLSPASQVRGQDSREMEKKATHKDPRSGQEWQNAAFKGQILRPALKRFGSVVLRVLKRVVSKRRIKLSMMQLASHKCLSTATKPSTPFKFILQAPGRHAPFREDRLIGQRSNTMALQD